MHDGALFLGVCLFADGRYEKQKINEKKEEGEQIESDALA